MVWVCECTLSPAVCLILDLLTAFPSMACVTRVVKLTIECHYRRYAAVGHHHLLTHYVVDLSHLLPRIVNLSCLVSEARGSRFIEQRFMFVETAIFSRIVKVKVPHFGFVFGEGTIRPSKILYTIFWTQTVEHPSICSVEYYSLVASSKLYSLHWALRQGTAHWIFDGFLTTANGTSVAHDCPGSYICSRTSVDANVMAAIDAEMWQCHPTNLLELWDNYLYNYHVI